MKKHTAFEIVMFLTALGTQVTSMILPATYYNKTKVLAIVLLLLATLCISKIYRFFPTANALIKVLWVVSIALMLIGSLITLIQSSFQLYFLSLLGLLLFVGSFNENAKGIKGYYK